MNPWQQRDRVVREYLATFMSTLAQYRPVVERALVEQALVAVVDDSYVDFCGVLDTEDTAVVMDSFNALREAFRNLSRIHFRWHDDTTLSNIIDAMMRALPTRNESVDEHRQRRREIGTLSTRRQRQAAEERRKKRVAEGDDSLALNWTQTEEWVTESGIYWICDADDIEGPVMDDGFLWQSVIWCIRNAEKLCENDMEIPANQPPALVAYTWLRGRPLFRALVKESIRRDLTFPSDVFRFLKDYVLDERNTLDGYEPWKDPRASGQAEELRDFLDRPLVPPEMQFGRDLRQIEL